MDQLFPSEGPEVKVIANLIKEKFLGKRIKYIYTYPRSRYRNGFDNLPDEMHFIDVGSKGKKTYIQISKDKYILFEQRNSGFFDTKESKIETNNCLKIISEDDTLYFLDSLHYGVVLVLNKEEFQREMNLMVWDSITEDYEEKFETLYKHIKKVAPIGRLIQGRDGFCSVGPYLKSELFFKARIHPQSIGRDISRANFKKICDAARELSIESYKNNGCYDQEFDGKKIKGNFSDKLQIFFKEKDIEGNKVLYSLRHPDKTCSFISPLQEVL